MKKIIVFLLLILAKFFQWLYVDLIDNTYPN